MNSESSRASVGQESGAIHRWAQWALAIYLPLLAVSTHWPRLEIGVTPQGVASIKSDKLLHFGAFVVLTTMLVYALPAGRRSYGRNLAAGTILAALYGYVDEHSQQWFCRTVSLADIVANHIGVVFTFLILFIGQTARPAPAGRLRLYRMLLTLIAAAVGWSVVASAWPRTVLAGSAAALLAGGPVVRLLGAMALTWLLAAARPAGRTGAGVNILVCTVVNTALGVVIEAAQRHGAPDADVVGIVWHQMGLLAGLCVWALVGLVQHAGRSQPLHWPPILNPHVDAPAAPRAEAPPRSRFVGHALRVSALTMVSRITGLLRDAVFAAVFGMGAVSDAFFLGFLIPNLFRRLFGEGALSASFIPVYSSLVRRDRLTARRLASMCLALMLVVLGALTLIGEGILAWLASSAGRSPDTALAIRLAMIMLPYMPMICIVAIVGSILQVHGRFGPPAAVPIVLNVTLISGVVLVTRQFQNEQVLRQCIVPIAACVLVAGFLQLLWQFSALLDVERLTVNITGVRSEMSRVLRAMVPMLIGLSVFQVNALLDSLIAYGLSPKAGWPQQLSLLGWHVPYPVPAGTISALHWSQRLYQFPLGVFGIAIATAIFPALAAAAPSAGRNNAAEFGAILRQGLRLTVFIGLPASVGLILVRLPMVRLIYEHGRFGIEEARGVALILAAYGSAVWAYSMTHVVTRAFYAVEDAQTPMRIGVRMVGLNLLLNLVLIWVFAAAGLALSTAICAVIQVGLLLRAMRRHVSHTLDSTVWRSWRRSAVLTAVMAAALCPALFLIDLPAIEPSTSALVLAIMVAGGGAVFVGGAWISGAEELRWLARKQKSGESGGE